MRVFKYLYGVTVDDLLDEPDGELMVRLLDNRSYKIANGKRRITYQIKDNDAPPTLTFDKPAVVANEAAGNMVFGVSLSHWSTNDVVIDIFSGNRHQLDRIGF